MFSLRALIFALLVFLCPAMAHAEILDKEQVEAVTRNVFKHIDQAMLDDGTPIGKEKAATLEYPVLPYDVREMIILRGTISGMAEACGMDWKHRNFGPLMLALHANKDFNKYQVAFGGLMHSASMMGGVQAMQSRLPCSDEVREWVAQNMIIKGTPAEASNQGSGATPESSGAAEGQSESASAPKK